MLYEIISPDAFLRPFIDDYATLSSIYAVVRNAYAKTGLRRQGIPEEDQRAGPEAHRRRRSSSRSPSSSTIDARHDRADQEAEGRRRRRRSSTSSRASRRPPRRTATIRSSIALAERAKAVQESFEDRQTSTAEALAELLRRDREERAAQARSRRRKGLDGLTYFVLCKLTDDGIPNAEAVSQQSGAAFAELPELAAQRDGAARAAQAGDVRALRRGGRPRQGRPASSKRLFTLLQRSFRP